MRRLTLVEYQTRAGVRLRRAERAALASLAPSVAISPSAVPGSYDLTPGSWVGSLDLGTLAVDILPKLPVERVLFLISYALDPAAWRRSTAELAAAPSLVEAMAAIFCLQSRRALRRGLLQGYRTAEAALPGVRGRLRFDAQLRERYGLFPPVEVRYDDFTEDVAENRLLKAAVARLRRLRLRSSAVAAALRALEAALARVTAVEYAPDRLPEVAYTRLNERYRPAVELARVILRGWSVELRRGAVPATGFLVDMNRVFEDFVAVALREALRLPERAFPQGCAGRRLPLDEAGALRLRPDLSWWDGAGCTFVGDVKYKRADAAGAEHADLYQLLAYATAADLPGGMLVYAAGEAEPGIHEVTHAGKALHVAAVDLAGPPAQVLAQIEVLAHRVRRLRTLALARSAA